MFVNKFLGGVNPIAQRVVFGRDMGDILVITLERLLAFEDTLGNTLNEAASPAIFNPAVQAPDHTTAFLNQIVPLIIALVIV